LDDLFENGVPSGVEARGRLSIMREILPIRTSSSAQNQLQIFFLKIDAEGYDPMVLDGAYNLLKNKNVLYFCFEYNGKWFTNGRSRTLKSVVAELFDLGYFCFYITEAKLIPVSDQWWSDKYELREWSNLFCGQTGQTSLSWIVESYNYFS
jgi:hypothetical protein